jgi:hypothetical protein
MSYKSLLNAFVFIWKDYRFEVLFVPLVELDGSGGNCLRVDGIVRCLARKD